MYPQAHSQFDTFVLLQMRVQVPYRLPVEETVPLMAELLSLALPADKYPPLTLTPQRQRQKTLETIVAMLLELAERQPVLFVVEDLHWTDPSTLELLDLLIDQTPITHWRSDEWLPHLPSAAPRAVRPAGPRLATGSCRGRPVARIGRSTCGVDGHRIACVFPRAPSRRSRVARPVAGVPAHHQL